MDDLAGQIDSTIRKLLPGLVRILDGALHAVAKAKFLCQADGYFARREGIVPGLDQVHEMTCIVRIQFGLYLGFQPETFPKVRRRPSPVWGIGLHISMHGGGGPAWIRRLN